MKPGPADAECKDDSCKQQCTDEKKCPPKHEEPPKPMHLAMVLDNKPKCECMEEEEEKCGCHKKPEFVAPEIKEECPCQALEGDCACRKVAPCEQESCEQHIEPELRREVTHCGCPSEDTACGCHEPEMTVVPEEKDDGIAPEIKEPEPCRCHHEELSCDCLQSNH